MSTAPHSLAALFPVSTVREEINKRLHRLKIGVSLEELRRYAQSQYFTRSPDQAEDFPYYRTYLMKRSAPRSPEARHHSDFLNWGLNVLEKAMLSCEQALLPEPKPLRTLMLDGLDLCQQFDQLEAQYHEELRTLTIARVRGGKARQAELDPARKQAARLLEPKRPPEGWANPTAAAKAIVDELKVFIRANRIAMATGDNLVRTIVRWIREVPMVTAAFQGNAA
jgi:hypothetical protein